MENQLHFLVENVLCRSEKPPENVCCKFCINTTSSQTTSKENIVLKTLVTIQPLTILFKFHKWK